MKFINDPVRVQREIIKKTYLIAIIPILSTLVSGELESLYGLIFGLIIGTLIFRLRLLNIKRSLALSDKKATTFIRNRYFIEYIIYFVVLFVARKNPSVNFLAAAVGLFLIKFTVIGWVIIDMIKEGWKKKLENYR